jgi:phenylalanyl-tRNA synthetase beta chain
VERAGGAGGAPYLRLRNPLQRSASRLRRSLAPALLEFVDRNVRAAGEVRMFECGRAFLPEGGAELPYEPQLLGAALAERVTRRSGASLRRLKGIVDELGPALSRAIRCAPAGDAAPAWAHPGRCARIVAGAADTGIGWIAQVHPEVADRFGWRGEAALFELDLRAALATEAESPTYAPPPRFPPALVDVSFLAPFALGYAEIAAGIRERTQRLARIDLVDEYTEAPIEPGWRSLTLRLSFRESERTLSDEEVAAEVERARAWLTERGARLRGEQG